MSDNRKKQGGFEDISSYSTPKGFKNKLKHFFDFKFKPFFLRNKKKNLKAVLAVLICFVIIVPVVAVAWINNLFGFMNLSDGNFGNPDAVFDDAGMDENLSFATIDDIESANSIKDLLRSWATNGGEHIYSKNVVNVLLIGEDDEDGTHRSDSTMLVSVNVKTKKITITSFLRDSYTYMDINGQERYCKTNHSYGWGGAATLMEVLSNNYKIKIDKYVSINYQSFKNAIDELGGVAVPITEAEASFMNRTTRVKGFTSGESVVLNGEQALIYARIRKLDSEVERTRRQRELITSVIRNVKASSLSDLNNAIEKFLPYVTTNFTKSEIISYGMQALREGWMEYEIVSMVEPSEELRCAVRGFRTYTGNLDVWIVDYIKAARELQLALYGQTNIEIDPATHISAIDLVRGSSSYPDSTEAENDYEYYETSTRRNIFDWNSDDDGDNGFSVPITIEIPSITLPSIHFGDEETTDAEESTDAYSEETEGYYSETTSYYEETTQNSW